MKGILFKPDMIKAIVEGRKMVTRRAIKPQPLIGYAESNNTYHFHWKVKPSETFIAAGQPNLDGLIRDMVRCARYQVGEVVYIKEALRRDGRLMDCCYDDENMTPVFRNGVFGKLVKWQWKGYKLSPMFIPEWAARYFIKITDVRPERLNDITPEDALAEGVQVWFDNHPKKVFDIILDDKTAIPYFQVMWNEINGKTYPYDLNPWVVRYQFELMTKQEKIIDKRRKV